MGRPRKKDDLPPEIVAYGMAAKRAGCPPDQLENLLKAGIFLQPKQLQFAAYARACDAPEGPTAVGMGGSRGPGKTHGIMAVMGCDDCQRFPGLKVLLLRKVVKANKEQFNDYRTKLFSQLPHKWREQAGELEFANGSKIVIGHFKDERDIDNYLGLEYDEIVVEELTTLSYTKYKNLLSCLRTSKQGWRPRLYASWNWGGVGHFFVKTIFWEPYKAKTEKDTRFIRATVHDNKFVNAEYLKYLESLTGWLRKSWLEGDPDFQAGQFFTNWRENMHVYPNPGRAFNEREAVKWWASHDYGFGHPACFLLFCMDKMGNTYTVDEYHQRETVIEEHAENVRAMLRLHNLTTGDLDYIAAGRDCFSRKEDGRTIADEYLDQGIVMVPAEVDRINGWAIMHQRLGDTEKGIEPSWFIHRKCTNLIMQIPIAQCHETRAGDIIKMNCDPETGEGGDDALDAARMGLSTEPSGAISFIKPAALTNRPYMAIGG